MVENATAFMSGHLQIQHALFRDDPLLRHLIQNQSETIKSLRSTPSVTQVTARLQTFALVSVEEQSAGALVMGVDVVNEKQMSTLPISVFSGRYLSEERGQVREVFMGKLLARNLGANLGDEVVVLGSQKEGAVAALVLTLVGIFDSGQAELDRSLLQIPIGVFREEFGLGDEAHMLAFNIEDIDEVNGVAKQLRTGLDENLRVYTWQELMPELQQTIDMKQSGSMLFFGLLVLMVTFSIVNTYIMTVAERTPEFGMLLAIGMKPWSIIGMLVFEALLVSLLGIALGVILSGAAVAVLSLIGIPLPAEVADLMRAYHLPDRLYPGWSWSAAFHAAWVILISTQLAAFLSTMKVRKLIPVEAMFRRA